MHNPTDWIVHTMDFVAPFVKHRFERNSSMRDRSDNHRIINRCSTTELYLAPRTKKNASKCVLSVVFDQLKITDTNF